MTPFEYGFLTKIAQYSSAAGIGALGGAGLGGVGGYLANKYLRTPGELDVAADPSTGEIMVIPERDNPAWKDVMLGALMGAAGGAGLGTGAEAFRRNFPYSPEQVQ